MIRNMIWHNYDVDLEKYIFRINQNCPVSRKGQYPVSLCSSLVGVVGTSHQGIRFQEDGPETGNGL